MKHILLASPRGFCAGVERAIDIVERALTKYGAPVYVRHEIVHNRRVVEDLKDKGAIFVEELADLPSDARVVFSAHGVAESVYREANSRHLRWIDATCPLVKKVHTSVRKHGQAGRLVLLIGHAGHPEVEGTMGQNEHGSVVLVQSVEEALRVQVPAGVDVAYTTQTTLSVDETREIIDALRSRFPEIRGPTRGDLCYATTNRQEAVRQIVPRVQLLLVIGSRNSSNTNRLRELGEKLGVCSHLIDTADQIDPAWLVDIESVGITSGASAPEVLVQDVVCRISALYPEALVESVGDREEDVHFALPSELS